MKGGSDPKELKDLTDRVSKLEKGVKTLEDDGQLYKSGLKEHTKQIDELMMAKDSLKSNINDVSVKLEADVSSLHTRIDEILETIKDLEDRPVPDADGTAKFDLSDVWRSDRWKNLLARIGDIETRNGE